MTEQEVAKLDRTQTIFVMKVAMSRGDDTTIALLRKHYKTFPAYTSPETTESTESTETAETAETKVL